MPLTTENKLLAALRTAEDALEWYASPRTWNQWLPDSGGERARKALAVIRMLTPAEDVLNPSHPAKNADAQPTETKPCG